MSYATLEEAWGADSKIAAPIVNVYEDKGYQRQVLKADSEPREIKQHVIRDHLSSQYRMHGLGGIVPLIDPVIIQQLCASRDSAVHVDDSLFVLLGLFAVLVLIDTF